MRELTKSMLGFSLAMPLFGMKQMMDIAMPRDPSRPFGKATDSFDAVTGATAGQMDGAWKGAFQAGDRLQRGMVDLMLGVLTGDSFDLDRMMRMTSGMLQTSIGAVGRGLGNCGCGGAARAAAGARPGDVADGPPSFTAPPPFAASPTPFVAPLFVAPPPSAVAPIASSGASAAAGAGAGAGALEPPAGWTVSIPDV
jgi:hypothetical protein